MVYNEEDAFERHAKMILSLTERELEIENYTRAPSLQILRKIKEETTTRLSLDSNEYIALLKLKIKFEEEDKTSSSIKGFIQSARTIGSGSSERYNVVLSSEPQINVIPLIDSRGHLIFLLMPLAPL